jgi:hypothetical protein
MTPEEWERCTDPAPMLEFLRGKVSDRNLRLFACAGWRWRYTRSAPRLLRWTLFRGMLTPLEKAERVADGRGESFGRAWWGSFTFGAPEAIQAALGTADTFRDGFLGLFDPSTEGAALCRLLRDIAGNPFRPSPGVTAAVLAYNGSAARRLAESIYAARRFEDLPVLADLLEEAGLTDAALLGHLRGPGPHGLGCWALDLVLGKE